MSGRRATAFGPALALFLAGPVIWIAHFMAVYLVAEALCTAEVDAGTLLGLPTVTAVTLLATVPAVLATALLARWALRVSKGPHGGLAFIGFLMGLLFVVALLFVGIPPVFLRPC